ncbi:MAG: serine/threonine protein kinase, partial [Candidatus Obscuribacterales bacterium]|nr:serine/threonine protein kinase [Candidatus Obscuribacterales bacterium]
MTEIEYFPELPEERYEQIEFVASGGIGLVFKAWDRSLSRFVAVKVLKSGFKETQIVRFQKEAQAAGRFKHPNLVTVLDFGQTKDDEPYLVMDYLEGRNLAEILEDSGRFSLLDTLSIFEQICAAMAHAHEARVLHRDLKPSNVMLVDCDPRRVSVLDFGIAQLQDRKNDSSGKSLIGSPFYMAPEQAQSRTIDERTDIYSFGCLMFACVCGHPPFVGATALETMQHHAESEPPQVADMILTDEVPADLSSLIQDCLKKDPQSRPDSFVAIAERLESLEEEAEVRSVACQSHKTTGGSESQGVPKRVVFKLKHLVVFSLIVLTGAVIAWIQVSIAEKTVPLPLPSTTSYNELEMQSLNFASLFQEHTIAGRTYM